jgi:hypothetical protein
VSGTDGLDGLQREPSREDAESREEPLLLRAEEVVAPRDRASERLVALGQVAPLAADDVEAIAQAREEIRQREELRAGGGQLDGERQCVQPATDLGDQGGVLGVAADGLGPIPEEVNGVVFRERAD